LGLGLVVCVLVRVRVSSVQVGAPHSRSINSTVVLLGSVNYGVEKQPLSTTVKFCMCSDFWVQLRIRAPTKPTNQAYSLLSNIFTMQGQSTVPGLPYNFPLFIPARDEDPAVSVPIASSVVPLCHTSSSGSIIPAGHEVPSFTSYSL